MNGLCYRCIHLCRPVNLLVLFLISGNCFTQDLPEQDTILKVAKGSYIKMKDFKSFITSDTIILVPASLVMAENTTNKKTMTFYDSLKVRASRSKFTRALYDLVIVSPDSTDNRRLNTVTTLDFSEYSGFLINSIQIRRLNVFGTDVSNPSYYSARGIEKILNSTHVNTNEGIIRKNLLFNEGDTISTLKLTDNERILRQLPFIDDAMIIVVPISDQSADIIIVTKDIYSLGADFTFRGANKGSVWIFDKNIFGMGHELKIEVPYSGDSKDSPGLGLYYNVNNISKSFINMNLNYYNGLGKKNYGFNITRNLVSSETKYAGGISISQTFTSDDLDTLASPEPLKFNFQDYWLLRSFLINRESVIRLIAGIRYINNNVFEKPLIKPNEYYALQRFRLYMGSVSFSMQKYYKTNLIYNYGRTEDIPYGTLVSLTTGLEINEFKRRNYIGTEASVGFSVKSAGYMNFSGGVGAFLNEGKTEQGVTYLRVVYFSNLIPVGKQMIRNFVTINYTRGFDRYEDEYLTIIKENGFSGFANDSLRASQRIVTSLETVIFNPINIYGFRIAFFGYADVAYLAGTRQASGSDVFLSSLGIGLRLRNDNLVFRTFQIRIGYFPSPPDYSRTNSILFSGEQLLRPRNFDPGAPAPIIYR